jgi:hypothetical protein
MSLGWKVAGLLTDIIKPHKECSVGHGMTGNKSSPFDAFIESYVRDTYCAISSLKSEMCDNGGEN